MTSEDEPTISKVRQAILSGWKSVDTREPDVQPYYTRRDELSVLKGCILWGSRVVMPPQGRDRITDELHSTHPGIVKMKSLARAYMWWPNMDKDLERKVNSCRECQTVRVMKNNRQPLHPWEYPDRAWSRLHIDYAGPMDGSMFLVIVDAYSKWVEVLKTSGSTSKITIDQLSKVFTTHGLPDTIVSDNGTAFTSEDFQMFVRRNGIRHVLSAPYHPATNGLAENAVKSFKRAVKKDTGESVDVKLRKYLFQQRITPHSTTGVAPSELLMKRRLKSRYDLLFPSVEQHVRSKQEMQAKNYGGKKKEYEEGDHVYFKNILHGMNESGVVIENTGPTSCRIRREDGVIVRKHFDQMMKQTVPADSRGEVVQEEFSEQVNERILPETVKEQIEGQRPRCERVVKQRAELVPEPELESRRSMRIKKPVEKLDI